MGNISIADSILARFVKDHEISEMCDTYGTVSGSGPWEYLFTDGSQITLTRVAEDEWAWKA